jgi:hypothetical protein
MKSKKIVTLPKKLKINSAYDIISKLNFIFSLTNKNKSDFILNLVKIREVDIFGILVLYKFIEYSVIKKCFEDPELNNPDDSPINTYIKQFGFYDLINANIKKGKMSNIFDLTKLKIEETETFVVAPEILIRKDVKTKKEFDKNFQKALNKFYGTDKTTFIESILLCAVEISSNFYNHAVNDTQTLILAKGTKSFIEIACADNADGIINSLKLCVKYSNKKDLDLMKIVTNRGVTSKPDSDHMGYGLWLVKEIVKKYNGILEIYSSGTNFSLKFGNTKVKPCPYWKGSIIYLKLPVESGIEIGDILSKNRQKHNFAIKVNFSNS